MLINFNYNKGKRTKEFKMNKTLYILIIWMEVSIPTL
jgi:hypothetical protein